MGGTLASIRTNVLQRLLAYRKGRRLLRELDCRVGAVQIDLADADMLAMLDTTAR